MADETERSDDIGETPAAQEHSSPWPLPKSDAKPSASAIAFSAKAKDLGALCGAVVDAAGVSAGLWLSYLLVLSYLAIAVGGVTHRDLLLENPLKLPILYVDVPLVGFFVLGPALFLIIHIYVLLHCALFASKVGVFHAELRMQIDDEAVRTLLRQQLPNNIFVQFLAGPRELRTGFMGFMLRFIAQITLVAAPLALLLYFQLQFLPYHSEPVTWWHRIAVIIDLVLLWALWPSLARGKTTWITWRDLRLPQVAAASVASLALVYFAFAVATFPGESVNWIRSEESAPTLADKLGMLFEIPRPWWSDQLFVSSVDVPETKRISLRGRRLEGAVLHNVDMRGVDFAGAHLQGALFIDANLPRANFECIEASGFTGLLTLRVLEEKPRRECTQLENASFVGSELQGSSFVGANLQGSFFDDTGLQGSRFDYAYLRGAYLVAVKLQGASLAFARLQGARLADIELEGASLNRAFLQGASLKYAHLQGASFDEAVLDGAHLIESYVWRADPRTAKSRAGMRVTALTTGPEYRGDECGRNTQGRSKLCKWSAEQFGALKEQIARHIPEGDRRSQALARIGPLDPAKPLDEEIDMAKAWADLEQSQPEPDLLENVLHEAGCNSDGAPFVIQGLIFQGGVWIPYKDGFMPVDNVGPFGGRFGEDRSHPTALAQYFLDEANCQGARGLSEQDKYNLSVIRDGAWPKPDNEAGN